MKRMTLLAAAVWLVALALAPLARADFGITSFDGSTTNQDGSDASQAGSHPFEAATDFSLTATTDSSGNVVPDQNVRDITVELPPGFIGNPAATPKCTEAQLATVNFATFVPACPVASQVGVTEVSFTLGGPSPTVLRMPVYNMVAPVGQPAMFGFQVVILPVHARAAVRTGGDYGVNVDLRTLSQTTPFIASSFTLWGVPADPGHNSERGVFCQSGFCLGKGGPSSAPREPFLTIPGDCSAGPLTTTLRADSWQDVGDVKSASFISHLSDGTPAGVDGCGRLPFEPGIEVQPDSSMADSPMGLSVDLRLPQNDNPAGLAEADLRKATVTLPAGVSVSPSAANGLGGCASAQIDIHNGEAAQCPGSSKIGTVEVETPLLDHPLDGSVYVAKQHDNPFNALLAIYIAIDDPQTGIVVKLAGRVEPNPNTGQLVTTFDDNPQLPFSDLKLNLFGGSRATLRTPPACGSYTTVGRFSSWSALDPSEPTPAEAVNSTDSFTIGRGPNGGPCPSGRFEPKLNAGVANPVAGHYSPFTLRVRREDGSQELSSVDLIPPPGLLAKLAGIPYCSDSAIGSIPIAEGTGVSQLASPSCPATSQVGTVSAGAGAGPSPFFVDTGRVYLAGPYKGAPLSLAIVTPAIAGPFDLGNVVVRTALHVDPESTRLTALSDPLPTILDGIPLDLRDVRVSIDRPRFTLNPTNCRSMSVEGKVAGAGGALATVYDHFEVGSCSDLGFHPRLSLSLKGGTVRGKHPALRALLKMPRGSANIRRAQVTLPHSEFLDDAHIGTVCTRVQYAAQQCPPASVYGFARAWTPLLDRPLEGPVYLRSSEHQLPDLVAALGGQIPISVDARIDSVNGGIRSTFAAVPDAPVTKFMLTMQGGKKGLLVNSTNLCAQTNRASGKFTAQNGRAVAFNPPLKSSCSRTARSKITAPTGQRRERHLSPQSQSTSHPTGGPESAGKEGI